MEIVRKTEPSPPVGVSNSTERLSSFTLTPGARVATWSADDELTGVDNPSGLKSWVVDPRLATAPRAAVVLGPVAFMLYVTRFQIVPEERELARHFGAEFQAYRERVRRWL